MQTPDEKMPPSAGDPGRAIELDHFSFRLAKNQILREVSFSVRKGEYLAIVGPNGAGKTTLIKMLCTLILPSEGRALVCGKDVVTEAATVKSLMGLVDCQDALSQAEALEEINHMSCQLRFQPPPEMVPS